VDVEAPAPQPGASHTTESNNAEEKEGSSDDEGDGNGNGNSNEELLLFSFISNPTQLNNVSNLRALRLLFDVSVRAAPAPTPTPAPLQHQHRLTNLRGLQETYDARGRTLWIFDSRSRADGCARLVSEAGDVASSVPPPRAVSPSPFLMPGSAGAIAGVPARRIWLNYRQTLPPARCASTLVGSIDGTIQSGSGICERRTQDMPPFFPR